MPLLTAAGLALIVCAVAAFLAGRIAFHIANGLAAVGEALFSIQSMRDGDWLWASVDAAFCAYYVWLWWHRGGGDGTRRRLRQLRRRFEGVRRTAPATA